MAIASNIGDAAERVPCVQNVRFGSLADIGQPIRDVRFAPESGHVQRRNRCLLCAINRHLHGGSRPRTTVLCDDHMSALGH